MAKYVLIESRDPLDAGDVRGHYDIAEGLRKEGNEVTLFLVENGVLPARKSPQSTRLSELAAAGVTVLADDFSLAERGIDQGRLADGVKASPLDVVVDGLAAGAKTIWH